MKYLAFTYKLRNDSRYYCVCSLLTSQPQVSSEDPSPTETLQRLQTPAGFITGSFPGSPPSPAPDPLPRPQMLTPNFFLPSEPTGAFCAPGPLHVLHPFPLRMPSHLLRTSTNATCSVKICGWRAAAADTSVFLSFLFLHLSCRLLYPAVPDKLSHRSRSLPCETTVLQRWGSL